MELWVDQRRGGIVEASHRIHAVLCDGTGRVLAQVGTDLVTTFRSAAKPFQLSASLDQLPAALVDTLPDDLVAIGAASHHGEPMHEAALRRLMGVLGVDESALLCGTHPPSHAESHAALLRAGRAPSAIHHNCSGKHAFMAAAARALAASHDYRPSAHPLQAAVLARVERATGIPAPLRVVDGCGVPCFVLPLSAMARAYAGLAALLEGSDTERASEARVVRGMRAHPWLVSGTGAFDLWLMEQGVLLAKVGALGLLCAALPGQIGLALKVESGSDAVRAVATAGFLAAELPGLLRAPLPERYWGVDNAAGQRVGDVVTRSAGA
jgi:L-asparaginase II